MTGHALASSSTREDSVDVHRWAEDIVPDRSPDDDRSDKVSLVTSASQSVRKKQLLMVELTL
jgi:hypothetical protein